jgi:UPF0271 protein
MELLKLNKKYLIIDTSAILSGKSLNINDNRLITTNSVLSEINPGGKDYRNLQFLLEKGLNIYEPSKESIKYIINISKKTGDYTRLSNTDIDILALAFDFKNKSEFVDKIIILSDDYSIQNISNYLKIEYLNISQSGITKRFKWSYKCMGCGKKFKKNIKTCYICGSSIKNYVSNTNNINEFK